MRILIFLALTVALAGCAKKSAQFTSTATDTAAVTPAIPKIANERKPDDKPNWLTDPRFNKKEQLPVESSPTGKPGWGVGAPAGGWTPTNVQPVLPVNPVPQAIKPNVGGAPAEPQTAPVVGTPAGSKPVAEADMKDVWIYIENASGAGGKMPGPEFVYAALIQAKSPAAELVKNGSIHLSGTRARETVWAYEAKALTLGGWVASQNGVEQLTAAELRRRLMSQ